jgi:proteasome lid subunit RPN8/RPN11
MEDTIVLANRKLLKAILEGARRLHPRETVFLLRGRSKGEIIEVSELLVPPLATRGLGFANIPLHMLPIDFSIVGAAHSHPSGNLAPSTIDLNNSFGKILMIVAPPYKNEENVAVYNRQGKRLTLKITET